MDLTGDPDPFFLACRLQVSGELAQLLGRPLSPSDFLMQLLVRRSKLFGLAAEGFPHAKEVDEDGDFGAEDLDFIGLDDIVHGAHGVAAADIQQRGADGGDKYDRRMFRPLAFADEGSSFKAVEVGHLDVEQDGGEILLQEAAEGFDAGAGFDEVLVEVGESGFEDDEVGRVVVDEKDVDLFRVVHRSIPSYLLPCPQWLNGQPVMFLRGGCYHRRHKDGEPRIGARFFVPQ